MSDFWTLQRGRAVQKRLMSNFGMLETSLWAAGVVLSLVMVVFNRLGPTGVPVDALMPWTGTLQTGAEVAQIAAFLLAVSIRVIKIIGVRNPAQGTLGNLAQDGRKPHLYNDLYQLLANDQVWFDRDVLQYIENSEDVREISEINSRSFSRSMSYGGDLDAKLQRNIPILQHCPMAFAFVVHGGDRIGFSSVVPLTDNFYRQYVEGKISDHDVVPEMIPAQGGKAGCLLLFAIGLLPEYERRESEGADGSFFASVLRAHGLHIRKVLEAYGESDTPLVIQAEKASIIRAVKRFGFRELRGRGADGDRLFEARPSDVIAALDRRLQRESSFTSETNEAMAAMT